MQLGFEDRMRRGNPTWCIRPQVLVDGQVRLSQRGGDSGHSLEHVRPEAGLPRKAFRRADKYTNRFGVA